MKLELSTRIPQTPVDRVFERFDLNLFEKLSPPFPPSKVLRFDGCHSGAVVEVMLFPGIFNIRWVSLVTEEVHVDGVRHAFTDVGQQLPPFLKSWKHVHEIVADGSDTLIHDRIEYEIKAWYPAFLMHRIMRRVFTYRQPVYRRELSCEPKVKS